MITMSRDLPNNQINLENIVIFITLIYLKHLYENIKYFDSSQIFSKLHTQN